MKRPAYYLVLLVLAGVLAYSLADQGAEQSATPSSPAATASSLVVTVTDDGIDMPASIESGFVWFVLDNQASLPYGHEIVRLRDGADPEQFLEGMIAFFSGTADEATMATTMASYELFLGGAVPTMPGTSRRVGLELTPGTYVVYADFVSDTDEEGPGLDLAHSAVVTVTKAADPTPAPTADYTIPMVEYAFALPAGITPGTHLVRFENVGSETHLGFVFKLPAGMTPEEAVASSGDPTPSWADAQGVHALEPGAVNYVEMVFEPGATYVFDCPIPNDEGVPHDHLGMQQFLTVPAL